MHGQITREMHYLATNQPRGSFQVIIPRQSGVLYNVASHGNYFYIHTNENGAKNYKVIKAPLHDPSNKEYWEEVLPHRSHVFVESIMLFRHHFVAFEWDNCVQKIRVQDLSDGGKCICLLVLFSVEVHYVAFSEPLYALWPGEIMDTEGNVVSF